MRAADAEIACTIRLISGGRELISVATPPATNKTAEGIN